MATRRCSTCGINYPTIAEVRICPECEGATDHIANADPQMTEAEAVSRCRHADFRRFCEGWDEERDRRGDPTPEQLGRLEARREARRMRAVARGIEEGQAAG